MSENNLWAFFWTMLFIFLICVSCMTYSYYMEYNRKIVKIIRHEHMFRYNNGKYVQYTNDDIEFKNEEF